MPITPTNLTKNAITPSRVSKGGFVVWDDSIETWDDPNLFWDSPLTTSNTNLTKHTITPTNLTKN